MKSKFLMQTLFYQVYWKEKLKYKFGNERKVRDRNLPEVQSRIRKRKLADMDTDLAVKKIALTWGLENYLPSRCPSEDEESIKIHIEWLHKEMKKTAPNMVSVDLKMILTFPERRADIVTKNMGVGELLQKYPWLHQRDQVLFFSQRIILRKPMYKLIEGGGKDTQ